MERIRLAVAEDLVHLAGVERSAGEAFRMLGMHAIADDEPLPLARLELYQRDGRAWVAQTDQALPAAYLLLDVVDGHAHIEQVSVHADHARRGLGRRLIDQAEDWARRRGLPGLTLTTFRDVAWNAPYYRRLGFAAVGPAQVGPELAALRRHEAATGLDVWPRVAMRRAVTPVSADDAPEKTDGRGSGGRARTPSASGRSGTPRSGCACRTAPPC